VLGVFERGFGVVDRARTDDHQQPVVFEIQDRLGTLARVFDEGGFKLSEPELMHEQGRLDERKDFGDAEVVSGMRKTHGK
jgi:hypothetical protein